MRSSADAVLGAAAGFVAGLAGAWVMNLFQPARSRLASRDDAASDGASERDDATVRTATVYGLATETARRGLQAALDRPR